MRIALLAPPWIPVPPTGYGGVESVVSLLAEGLVGRGHEVTLYAAPGSRSVATVRHVLDEGHPDEIERALYEADHVARVFADVDQAGHNGFPFDVVHDHCGFTALAMADRLPVPSRIIHETRRGLDFPLSTAGSRVQGRDMANRVSSSRRKH